MAWIAAMMLFGSPDPPPEWVRDLPPVVKKLVLKVAQDVNLTHPAAERPWLTDIETGEEIWDYFDGTMYVLRRRFNRVPLPYSHDPVRWPAWERHELWLFRR